MLKKATNLRVILETIFGATTKIGPVDVTDSFFISPY